MESYLAPIAILSLFFLQTSDFVIAKSPEGVTIQTELEHDQAAILYRYAIIREQKGDINGALASYSNAINLNPQHDLAYVNRGIIYAKQRQYNLALLDFRQAIELNSKDAKAFYNRGIVYGFQEKYELAIADYNQAIALKSDYILAYAHRGILHEELGDNKLALSDFEHVIALDPQDPRPYFGTGLVYLKLEDYKKAYSNLLKAKKLFLAQGDTESAEEVIKLLRILNSNRSKYSLQLKKNFDR